MPNPIIIQFAFWLYTISLSCAWQPVIRYPQPANEYRYECVVIAQGIGQSEARMFFLSGLARGPFVVGGSDSDSNITQETY